MSKGDYKFFEKIGHNFFARKVYELNHAFLLSIGNVTFDFNNNMFITDNAYTRGQLYAGILNGLPNTEDAYAYDQLHYNDLKGIWDTSSKIDYW
jgi:hypothetical protein